MADFIFALNYPNQLSLIYQEFTLVSILIPKENGSIIIYIFFLFLIIVSGGIARHQYIILHKTVIYKLFVIHL